ncbi:MAG: crotonase/enoyl-CoA hydratase family protein [Actinomycetota bacterium]
MFYFRLVSISSEDPHLLISNVDGIVTLTMNRPDARNALSSEMVVRLADAWEMINSDDDVRVAILTGAGGHFCAGADLKSMAGGYGDSEWTKRTSSDPQIPWRALLRNYTLKKPLIAAVEGYAVAGGTEILQATDIRIAGSSATFGVAEVRRGLFPLGGSTVRLRRQIPYTKAMEMLLTGDFVSAQDALEMGLIGRIVPDGTALHAALEIAKRIAANAPLSVLAIKRSVNETEGLPEAEALNKELEIGMPIFGTEDAREGARAFSEKRAPQYKGR